MKTTLTVEEIRRLYELAGGKREFDSLKTPDILLFWKAGFKVEVINSSKGTVLITDYDFSGFEP